jgi:hypothetical protein
MAVALFMCGCNSVGGTTLSEDLLAAQARQEIAELQRQYGQATDLITVQTPEKVSETRAVYQRVFTADAVIGVQGQMSVTGPDAWVEVVQSSQSTLVGSQHLIGTQVVDRLEMPDEQGVGGSATLTSYLSALQLGEKGERTRISGSYVSQVTHSAGLGWQISQMTLKILAVAAEPAGD